MPQYKVTFEASSNDSLHNVVTMSHDITSVLTGWVLTNWISISLSEAMVSHREERLPYPRQKRVADSSSSISGCSSGLMQKRSLAIELPQLHFLFSSYFVFQIKHIICISHIWMKKKPRHMGESENASRL